MNLQDRKKAFVRLGTFMGQLMEKNNKKACNNIFHKQLKTQIKESVHHNGWFTSENVHYALETWSKVLIKEKIDKWTKAYDLSEIVPKSIGIITAGNIPLVGFHDFITVLMAGHKVIIKQSSNDQKLLPVLADFLICIEPRFKDRIIFKDDILQDFDAIIATGSNNTARYFEHYFNKYPHIIRKNRNAIAVLKGSETEEELEALGEDIFRYFGLGCRSVSKIFVPKNYNFDKLFKGVFKQNEIINYKKYKNNYDYNKTIYLMSQIPLLENGFLVLKEDTNYASPIATLFYEYYDSLDNLNQRLVQDKEQIQCIVSNDINKRNVSFGQTQQPQLWDYADGVDTMQFLLKIK